MKLVSRAPLAGAATCVQHQWLVSSQSTGGGGREGIEHNEILPAQRPIRSEGQQSRSGFPHPCPGGWQNKVHQKKKGRPAEILDTMAKPLESAAGHRSFPDKPAEFIPPGRFSSAKQAQRKFTRVSVSGPDKHQGSLSDVNHASEPICKIIYV